MDAKNVVNFVPKSCTPKILWCISAPMLGGLWPQCFAAGPLEIWPELREVVWRPKRSPIEGDLTYPKVKNPSFPFNSFQLKIDTSVCFDFCCSGHWLWWSRLYTWEVAIDLLQIFVGGDLCWGTVQPWVIKRKIVGEVSFGNFLLLPSQIARLTCPHFTNCLHDRSCIYGVGFAVQATSKISTSPSTQPSAGDLVDRTQGLSRSSSRWPLALKIR